MVHTEGCGLFGRTGSNLLPTGLLYMTRMSRGDLKLGGEGRGGGGAPLPLLETLIWNEDTSLIKKARCSIAYNYCFYIVSRVYNEERVSNAPLPYRKHSRESNVIVTRPKTARYDVYTLIKVGIDRRGLLQHLPQCLEEMLHSEEGEKVELLRHSS